MMSIPDATIIKSYSEQLTGQRVRTQLTNVLTGELLKLSQGGDPRATLRNLQATIRDAGERLADGLPSSPGKAGNE